MGKTPLDQTAVAKRVMNSCSENEHWPLLLKSNKIPDSLPEGWIVEVKARKGGSVHKCYTDTVSGRKFYSLPKVSQYLETIKSSCSTSNQCHDNQLKVCEVHSNSEVSKCHGVKCVGSKFLQKMPSKVVIEKERAIGLPPGWIKETRIRENSQGIRKDSYYTDPVTGRLFRSKISVLRRLGTEKMNREMITQMKNRNHVITHMKGVINDQESINPLSTPKRQKLTCHSTAKPVDAEDLQELDNMTETLAEMKEKIRIMNSALPKARAPERRGRKKKYGVNSVSNHTPEHLRELSNMTGNNAEMMEKTDISNSALLEARATKRRGRKKKSGNSFISNHTPGHLQELNNITGNDTEMREETDISIAALLKAIAPKKRGRKKKNSGNSSVSNHTPEYLRELDNMIGSNTETREKTDISISALMKTRAPKRRGRKKKKSGNSFISNHTPEYLQEKTGISISALLRDRAPKKRGRKKKNSGNGCISNHTPEYLQELDNMTGNNDEMEEKTNISISALLKARAPKRSGRKKNKSGNSSVSSFPVDALKDETIPKDQNDSPSWKRKSSSKNRTELNTPCRFSKRLAGLQQPEVWPTKNEATAGGSMDDGETKRPAFEPEAEISVENPGTVELESELFMEDEPEAKQTPIENSFRGLAAPAPEKMELEENKDPQKAEPSVEHAGGAALEENKDESQQPLLSLVDSWADPCLDFAFKTLTGVIPFEDDLVVQGYFQQHVEGDPALGQKPMAEPHLSSGDVMGLSCSATAAPELPARQL